MKPARPSRPPDFYMDFGECSEANLCRSRQKKGLRKSRENPCTGSHEVMAVDIKTSGRSERYLETYDRPFEGRVPGRDLPHRTIKKYAGPSSLGLLQAPVLFSGGIWTSKAHGGLMCDKRRHLRCPPSETLRQVATDLTKHQPVPFFSCRPCLPRSAWKNPAAKGCHLLEAEPSPNPCTSTRNPSLRPKKKVAGFFDGCRPFRDAHGLDYQMPRHIGG